MTTPEPLGGRKKVPMQGESRGIGCPTCGCKMSEVLYTRDAEGEKRIRQRQCRNCGGSFRTVEITQVELYRKNRDE